MTRAEGLRIAPDLTMPPEAVTQTFAILAIRGSGKTYTAAVMVEEMVKAGLPVAVIDPIGVWWGLRADAAGTGPGLPVVVFGGDHGDLPLDANSGEAIADAIVDLGPPTVVDLSLLRKGEQQRFATAFAESLYHRNRDALHLVLDEADAWAPQRPVKGQERLLGAVEDLVRRGRARGLGVTLITQRPAVLHKDVLTQVQVLVSLRMVAPHDREAIDTWVRVHGTPEQRDELMASLPSLPIGNAWIWSPGWLDLFQRVEIRKRETFDSSATPKVGEVRRAPKQPASVDLEELRAKIAETIEAVECNDPKALRKRIAELERQVKARPEPERIVERVEVPVIGEEAAARITAALTNIVSGTEAIQAVLLDSARRRGKVGPQPESTVQQERPAPLPFRGRAAQRRASEGEAESTRETVRALLAEIGEPEPRLRSGQRRILEVLAKWHPARLTVPQLGALARLSHSGGTFGGYVTDLQRRGLIEMRGRGEAGITEEGFAALGSEPPVEAQTPAEILAAWKERLPAGTSRVLDVLVEAYPEALDREELAERAGLTASGGTFGAAIGVLKRYALAEQDGSGLRLGAMLVGEE